MHRVQPPPACSCESCEEPVSGLLRRHLIGAGLLGGLGAIAGPAAACTSEAAAQAGSVVAPRTVCMECLARRAQQRSPFVNKELS
ncbi:hypothetical protein KUF54_08510 [Comamonas sp. Y33R10-2]|uniref:hypothetical protein n=1 Tax=Comamonas sp. Y33R10-2 TaxID=2853257 RepID=UPI001C5C9B26|nr:hypothetical protein [Comamonas sp. Y33R10-2]QXZ11203.1 hypothetical protein KUF54_08510 [Comamonas sp. Y33R10-2]